MNHKIREWTFQQLIEIGIAQGAQLHDGMPWSFKLNGLPVTHEDDNTYVVGSLTVRHTDMLELWTGDNGFDILKVSQRFPGSSLPHTCEEHGYCPACDAKGGSDNDES